MNETSVKIARICECIDHCFAYAMWCEDFARHVDPDDMVMGLDRAYFIVSDATRLQSFLALRKLHDFFGGVKPQKDDLIAENFGVDTPKTLGDGNKFLSTDERENINKGVAHLTDKFALDEDSEVNLDGILERSIPVFERLVAELRKSDASNEAKHWLDQTETLIKHAQKQRREKA
jgi:hypothetical protein